LISCAGDKEMEEVHDRLLANVGGISPVKDEIEVKSADKDMVCRALYWYV